MAAEAAGGTG